MEQIVKKLQNSKEWIFIFKACLGCALITLCSLVKIPFYPVPFTLQTLAVFIIALTQEPRQAFASGMCYLFCASLGLPVLCGGSNPFWIMGKCGGYLVGFPLAAYLISVLRKKCHPILAILCGQVVIFGLGFLWLIPFFGVKIAWLKGVLLFIPSGLLKNIAAVCIVRRK